MKVGEQTWNTHYQDEGESSLRTNVPGCLSKGEEIAPTPRVQDTALGVLIDFKACPVLDLIQVRLRLVSSNQDNRTSSSVQWGPSKVGPRRIRDLGSSHLHLGSSHRLLGRNYLFCITVGAGGGGGAVMPLWGVSVWHQVNSKAEVVTWVFQEVTRDQIGCP